MSRKGRGLAFLVVVAALGAACRGSGSTASSSGAGAGADGNASGSCPAAAALPTPANDHGAAAASGSTIRIKAEDFFFTPTCVTALPSGMVKLEVHNAGQALHNVTIESLGIDQDVPPGQTVTISLKVGASPVPFFCKYHRSSGMVGALVPAAA